MIVTKYAPISQFFAGGGARGPDLRHLSFMYSFCPKSPLLGKKTLTVQVATLQVLAEIIDQIQYLIPGLSGWELNAHIHHTHPLAQTWDTNYMYMLLHKM